MQHVPTPQPPVEAPQPSQRNLIRAKILETKQPKSKIISFFGADIEIRQPKLNDILAARDGTDDTARVVNILLMYAYIPGTNEKIFEEGDKDALGQMPFGADFISVTEALEELSKVNFPKPSSDSK